MFNMLQPVFVNVNPLNNPFFTMTIHRLVPGRPRPGRENRDVGSWVLTQRRQGRNQKTWEERSDWRIDVWTILNDSTTPTTSHNVHSSRAVASPTPLSALRIILVLGFSTTGFWPSATEKQKRSFSMTQGALVLVSTHCQLWYLI